MDSTVHRWMDGGVHRWMDSGVLSGGGWISCEVHKMQRKTLKRGPNGKALRKSEPVAALVALASKSKKEARKENSLLLATHVDLKHVGWKSNETQGRTAVGVATHRTRAFPSSCLERRARAQRPPTPVVVPDGWFGVAVPSPPLRHYGTRARSTRTTGC